MVDLREAAVGGEGPQWLPADRVAAVGRLFQPPEEAVAGGEDEERFHAEQRRAEQGDDGDDGDEPHACAVTEASREYM